MQPTSAPCMISDEAWRGINACPPQPLGCGGGPPVVDIFKRPPSSAGQVTMETRVLDALRRADLTLATAESLTGGLLSARLTDPPRASDVFRGGVVSYTDGVKAAVLGVDRKTLEEKGAVTAEVARMMAEGARERLGADLAVSLTGFAGPDVPPGGELGLVYVGLAHEGGSEARELRFGGDRAAIRAQSAEEAMRTILAFIEGRAAAPRAPRPGPPRS